MPVGVRMFGVEGKKSLAVAYADWTSVCTAEYAEVGDHGQVSEKHSRRSRGIF